MFPPLTTEGSRERFGSAGVGIPVSRHGEFPRGVAYGSVVIEIQILRGEGGAEVEGGAEKGGFLRRIEGGFNGFFSIYYS